MLTYDSVFGSQYIVLVLLETMSEKSTCVGRSESEHEDSDDTTDDDSDDSVDQTMDLHTQSNLVTRLLMRATSGSSSYSSAQGDAYGGYLDGLRHPEVSLLASCGDWGSVPGNVRRDVHTAFFKSLGYPKPEKVEVFVKHPGSG